MQVAHVKSFSMALETKDFDTDYINNFDKLYGYFNIKKDI